MNFFRLSPPSIPHRLRVPLASAALLAFLFGLFAWPAAHAVEGSGGTSASALFNQGNAYVRTDRLGRAVLSYERARLLSPRDPDIAVNLTEARRRADVAEPPPPAWKQLSQRLTLDEWSRMGAGALFLLALLFVYRGIVPHLRRRFGDVWELSPRAHRGLTMALVLLLLAGGLGTAAAVQDLDRGVAVDGDLVLRISPFEEAEAAGTLPEGRLVDIERAFDDHVFVRSADGRSGWAAATQVGRLRPASGA